MPDCAPLPLPESYDEFRKGGFTMINVKQRKFTFMNNYKQRHEFETGWRY